MNINVNSQEADDALLTRLAPFFIPGASTTVLPSGTADYGVPHALYSPTQRLAFVIDPLQMLAQRPQGEWAACWPLSIP